MGSSKDDSGTDGDNSGGELPDSKSGIFSEGEKVLAYHGPRIYEAKGYDVVAIACPERFVVGVDISDKAIKKAMEARADCIPSMLMLFGYDDYVSEMTCHSASLQNQIKVISSIWYEVGLGEPNAISFETKWRANNTNVSVMKRYCIPWGLKQCPLRKMTWLLGVARSKWSKISEQLQPDVSAPLSEEHIFEEVLGKMSAYVKGSICKVSSSQIMGCNAEIIGLK